MPTMPERMAIVETKVASIDARTVDIQADVKVLVAWREQERGAFGQRSLSVKQSLALLSAVSVVFNIAFRLVVS